MDLVGRNRLPWGKDIHIAVSILLSQWIWLEGWADTFFSSAFVKVSILLSQWIWLEANTHSLILKLELRFQSFWVNGFGWKHNFHRIINRSIRVSILLSQWIWLEVPLDGSLTTPEVCFNPSESMDLVGRLGVPICPLDRQWVSILLSQWIWLEVLLLVLFLIAFFSFQSFWVNGFGWKLERKQITL